MELGARLLGSGGAGDPHLMTQLLRSAWPQGVLSVVEADDLAPDDLVIAVGLVGSVTAFAEKPAAGEEFAAAFQRLRSHLGSDRSILVSSYETAGVNALSALLVSAQLHVPIVDVDGMGRGLSWVNQTTYDAAGLAICPFVLTQPAGHTFLVEATPGNEAERYVRSLTVQMGGWSSFAGYPLTGAQAKGFGVVDALARCLSLGRALSEAHQQSGGDVAVGRSLAATEPGGRYLGRGRVVDMRWNYAAGYPVGSLIVMLAGEDGRPLRVEARNEYLAIIDLGEVVAAAPEIIGLIETHSGIPLLAEQVVRGAEVDIVIVAPPVRWTEPAFAERVSLSRVGYDLEIGVS